MATEMLVFVVRYNSLLGVLVFGCVCGGGKFKAHLIILFKHIGRSS